MSIPFLMKPFIYVLTTKKHTHKNENNHLDQENIRNRIQNMKTVVLMLLKLLFYDNIDLSL